MPVPSKLTVDFTGVEISGGKPADHVPEGDYLLQIENVEIKKKKGDETSRYLNWYLGILRPAKFKGKHIYHITSLKPENLWSLRGFLADLLGAERVPQKSLDIPLATIVAKKLQIGATLQDDEYTNTTTQKTTIKSKIAATFPKADYAEAEAEAASASGNGVAATEEEEEEETEVDELDVDDL